MPEVRCRGSTEARRVLATDVESGEAGMERPVPGMVLEESGRMGRNQTGGLLERGFFGPKGFSPSPR